MKNYFVKSVNGQLANETGNVNIVIPTRFSKNVNMGAGTNIFIKYDSNEGDIIPAGTISGNGKIYPSALNSNSDMIDGDIVESSFIIERIIGSATSDYVFKLEFWRTADSGGTAAVQFTYSYTWDTVVNPVLSIKIIFTKRSNLSAYGYLISYMVLINGVFAYNTANFYSWDKADCRMFLVNNNDGTNTIVFNQHQATNLFIPVSQSLT